MKKNKDTHPEPDKNKLHSDQSSDEKIFYLTKSISSLSSELEGIKENLQKRKSENTTLRVLFYTGLLVLLVGFLY